MSPASEYTWEAAGPRVAARVQAVLWLLGGLMGVLAWVSGAVEPGAEAVFLGVLVGTATVGIALWRLAEKIPTWVLQAGGLAAIVHISIVAQYPGHRDTDIELLYLWTVLSNAFFFGARATIAQIAGVGAAYGGVLLGLGWEDGSFARWMNLVGTAVGTAIVVMVLKRRVARMFEALNHSALHDQLTDLPNRRGFDAAFNRELARGQRHDRPLGVIVFDVDHFKKVNDRFGHDGGDEALRHVAGIVAGELRAADSAARWGGEEFAVLLPETDVEGALAVAERIRARVAGTPHELTGTLTVSAGVSAYPDDGASSDAILRVADSRLYEAKDGGRDQVCGAKPAPACRSAVLVA